MKKYVAVKKLMFMNQLKIWLVAECTKRKMRQVLGKHFRNRGSM